MDDIHLVWWWGQPCAMQHTVHNDECIPHWCLGAEGLQSSVDLCSAH